MRKEMSIAAQMRKARKVLSKPVVTRKRLLAELPLLTGQQVLASLRNDGWSLSPTTDAYFSPRIQEPERFVFHMDPARIDISGLVRWLKRTDSIVLAKSYEHLAASFPAETKVGS